VSFTQPLVIIGQRLT